MDHSKMGHDMGAVDVATEIIEYMMPRLLWNGS